MNNVDSSLHSVVNYIIDKSKKTKALHWIGMYVIFLSIDYDKLKGT
jgi:hypothetical protein